VGVTPKQRQNARVLEERRSIWRKKECRKSKRGGRNTAGMRAEEVLHGKSNKKSSTPRREGWGLTKKWTQGTKDFSF